MADETRTDAPGAHDHAGMDMPAEDGARFGAPGSVDVEALGLLVGAAFDGCVPCQEASIGQVAGDPLTLTRLVELSAVAVAKLAGGLPPTMLAENDDESTLGGPYRAMLRAGADQDGVHTRMYALADRLSEAGRRQVTEDALDMLTGVLVIGPGL